MPFSCPCIITFAAMQKITIKVVNQSGNELPSYATEGAAGMDLRANIETPITLQPLERRLVPTGLYMEIPMGYEAQVRPRSGMAINHGITCLNTPGTIDSDYRGEIKVILINLGSQPHTIQQGDRIAQVVFNKIETAILQPAEVLTDTSRGAGGFGHTGRQ
ncbi:MAG TPA: dUTP diphosphatase [Ferruginibacter sp.]|nr:dUTP diphosphatase [Ferruginibacter sp.]HMP22066.1 dUTP diphosphatase [Ferruginibacter sp.]